MTHEWKSPEYYYFPDDIASYPDAWCYVVWSRRGPGKTYSALRASYEDHIPILYMKRTIKDVEIICKSQAGLDLSPYSPINRDKGTCITPLYMGDGLGGFYDTLDDNGKPCGNPFSMIAALSAMKTIKGMDVSFVDWMLLDEFIPLAGEVVRKKEGEMLLDLYMTASRDRQKRGRGSLKLILFANAENITTPITTELDIVDHMIDLTVSGDSHMYIESRGIMLHHITTDEVPLHDTEKSGIYKAMEGTAWAAKTFGGDFANNDFTAIQRVSLKGYKPLIHVHYKLHDYYIYNKESSFYMCDSRQSCGIEYDLDIENDQKRFWLEHAFDLRRACIDGLMRFQRYTMYDLIVNYRKIFEI